MAPRSSSTIDIDVSSSGSSNATGSARTVVLLEKELVSLGKNPRRGNSRIVPVKHAKGIRDREAFEGQRLASFPRAGRMTGFLVVCGLWKGGCYFWDTGSTVRKMRVRHEFAQGLALFLSAATIAMSAASNALPS